MKKLLICWGVFLGHIWDRNRPQIDTEIELRMLFKKCNYLKKPRKRQGNHRMGKNTCELWISRVMRVKYLINIKLIFH
ncbi:TPA: hypothetical protein ACM486_005040, partial [Escherichia coli]